jgi:hypothetical protein
MQDKIIKKYVIHSLKGWKVSNFGNKPNESKFIHEEIKSRLKPRNACYHLVQNLCLQVCFPKI